uniref:Retrotransposon protein, putative, Ty1-copia subclass n=1 Tax=Oryza sativa subsp. japonica TaxID=39947 RepID=Q2QSV3_ORYSJ|nr:retrotransposon protein, putative, Ty1-copia subclass [Oryza sativa Japonica Group]
MSTTGDNNNTGDKEKEPLVNTNGGNTASNSSGGPFSGYNVSLLPSVLRFLQLSVTILLRSFIYVDAYSILSMLMLYTSSTVTRSTQITNVMLIVLIFWIKICRIMTKFPTLQKLDWSFSVVGFAASLKPHAFDGSSYKRWKARALLWLMVMHCFFVSRDKPSEPLLSPDEEAKFEATDCLFHGALISVLADNIVDVYMHIPSGKDMWDALEAKFGVSDAGSELYVMEQFYDYKMVDDRSVVEQAHEIQILVKELEKNNCDLPEKFVAGGIIANMPPSWSDFATSVKHKRQAFSVTDLIGSLGIEEKARAKDNRGKNIEEGFSANLVQKKNPHASHNNNQKVKPDVKPKATTNFKKKGKGKAKGDCFVCGKPGHWAKDCPERKDKKSANMVISEGGGTLGYG